jgi:signal transduction histidine kinase
MIGPGSDALLSPSGFAAALDKRLTGVDGLIAVSEILEFYVQHFRAFGAALWVFVDGLGADGKGRLFLQAESFPTLKHAPFYHLDVASSISGRAVRDNVPALHRRTAAGWDSDIRVSYPDVLDRIGIDCFASIPIHLTADSDRPADAALTFYRQHSWFAREEFEELQQAALLFALAYRFVVERASQALVREVHAILRCRVPAPEERADAQSQPSERPESRMQRVLDRIAAHFGFVEASIYLHNPSTDPAGRFTRVAEVWPWSKESLDSYLPGDGGLGWVLQTGRPLRLLDLVLYSEDRDYYQRNYPGMVWNDRLDIKSEVRRNFELSEDEVWPLSYVCLPVTDGNEIEGALRCCISRKGPYHVDDNSVAALSTAADLISDWWANWTRTQQEREARQSALSMVRSIGTTARYAIDHVRHSASADKVVSRMLDLCRESVPQADIVELWMEESEGVLALADFGAASSEPRRKASTSEFIGEGKRNAFRNALSVRVVLNTEKAEAFAFAPPDRNVSSFTVAPVISKGARGILFFGASRETPWPAIIAGVAGSLADQLALYLDFQHQIRAMEETQAKLENSAQQQANLFLDFQHQLRSPILIVRHSLQSLQRSFRESTVRPEFEDLTSAARRAATVANNLHVFVALSRGDPISASMVRLPAEKALEAIEEAARVPYNQRALNKTVRFEIRKDYPIPLPLFMADPELLDLAIDNLLDNAVKYSYPDTSVFIQAVMAGYGREIYFSFRTKGLPLSPADSQHVKERGYRSEMARMTSPEGGGIGLWIVEKIMEAMSGRLDVIPANEEGWLDFRLSFKCYL